jgi:hypothetical protein
MVDFFSLWFFTLLMLAVYQKLDANKSNIFVSRYFLGNKWITEQEVLFLAGMMAITNLITGFFLIEWYYDLIISLLFLTLARFVVGIINVINIRVLFYTSIIGFTITMLIIMI